MHADGPGSGVLVHGKNRPTGPDEQRRCGVHCPIRVHLCASVAKFSCLLRRANGQPCRWRRAAAKPHAPIRGDADAQPPQSDRLAPSMQDPYAPIRHGTTMAGTSRTIGPSGTGSAAASPAAAGAPKTDRSPCTRTGWRGGQQFVPMPSVATPPHAKRCCLAGVSPRPARAATRAARSPCTNSARHDDGGSGQSRPGYDRGPSARRPPPHCTAAEAHAPNWTGAAGGKSRPCHRRRCPPGKRDGLAVVA